MPRATKAGPGPAWVFVQAAPFAWSNIRTVVGGRGVRLESHGHFGHMWELHATWVNAGDCGCGDCSDEGVDGSGRGGSWIGVGTWRTGASEVCITSHVDESHLECCNWTIIEGALFLGGDLEGITECLPFVARDKPMPPDIEGCRTMSWAHIPTVTPPSWCDDVWLDG